MAEVKAANSAAELEFVRDLTDQVGKNKLARVVPGVDLGPRRVLIEHDGKLTERELPAKPRKYTARDVSSFVAAVIAYQPATAKESGKAVSAAWVDDDAIVGLFDVDDRTERVTMLLVKSIVAETLYDLTHNPLQSQSQLISLLRGPLSLIEECDRHLLNFRTLKFEESSSQEQVKTHGGDSLGLAARAKVTGAAELPEVLEIQYAIYTNSELRSLTGRVRLLVEVDLAAKKIGLMPHPEDLEEHRFDTMTAIVEKLRGEFMGASVDVFAGSP